MEDILASNFPVFSIYLYALNLMPQMKFYLVWNGWV